MSLEGNLTAFGLSEILQLIAIQQKSGMLTVTSQDRAKVFFFSNGKIISTRDRRHKARDPLKDYLTRYGIVSSEDLVRLTQVSDRSKLDLTDVLVSERIVTEERMKQYFRDHVQEELHDLLAWDTCSYKFIPGTDLIDGIKRWGEYSIEALLMESMRRIDEFPAMLDMFPDTGIRIARRGAPKPEHELTPTDQAVLRLLDQDRTLAHLIGHAKIPQFETYEALKHLKEKDLIVAFEDDLEVREDKKFKRKRRRVRRARKNPVPVLLSLVLFAAAALWGAASSFADLPRFLARPDRAAAGEAGEETSFARHRAEEQLRWVLEAYCAKTGRYPASLSDLAETGLASASFLDRIEGYEFKYHLTAGGSRYTLL